MKKFLKLLLASILTLSFIGCAQKPMDDEAFLDNLEKGLVERWKITDNETPDDSTDNAAYKKYLKKAVEAELKVLGDYKEYTFKDKKLSKLAKDYYSALNLQKEGCKYYDFEKSYDENSKYSNTYDLGYNQRAVILDTLVKEYDFKVLANKDDLDDIIDDVDDAKKFIAKRNLIEYLEKNTEFKLDKKKTDEYSTYYSAVVENITDVEFEDVQFEVSILDKDGVVQEQTSGNVQNFKPGQKAKVELYLENKSFDKMEVSVSIYE